MEFRLEEDEVYFREEEEYGIIYSKKNKSFFKIPALIAQELRELKKQEKNTHNPNLSSLFDISKLRRIELIMSTACNLKCKYCFASGGNYNQEISSIKLSVLDKVIDLIEASKNIQEIVLFGGEPTLAEKEIEYLCNSLERKRIMIKYKMVTNLYQISDKMIDLINKYNIILTISLDGPEYINNKNRVARDGGNVYQRVLHNYKRLNTKGVKIKAIEATYTLSHKEAGITKEKLKESFNQVFEVEDIYIVDDLNEKKSDLYRESDSSFQKKELEAHDRLFLANYFLINRKKCGICDSGISSICIDPQ